MYIAIGIAAALFAADRILKYLSRTGKLKWNMPMFFLTDRTTEFMVLAKGSIKNN